VSDSVRELYLKKQSVMLLIASWLFVVALIAEIEGVEV